MNKDVLAAHPSVQDLGIQYGGINLAKTSLHKMLINSKPLHEMSDSDYAAMGPHRHKKAGGRACEPKDAKVVVTRNTVVGPTPPLAPNNNSTAMSLPAIMSPTTPGGGTMTPMSPVAARFSVTNTRTNATAAAATGGADAARKQQPRVITQLPPRRNPSLVSSAFSYSADGCSDCGSFSMYSCSCCHVKAPSSVASAKTSIPSSSVASSRHQKQGLTYYRPRSGSAAAHKRGAGKRAAATASESALRRLKGGGEWDDVPSEVNRRGGRDEEDLDQYENLTSVSQRISHASVTSSQIASLQQELESERRTRLQTQIELQSIRERQKALLDRLASKEHGSMNADDKYTIRRMLKEVNSQMVAMGVAPAAGAAVRGSTVGAPVDADDSVLK